MGAPLLFASHASLCLLFFMSPALMFTTVVQTFTMTAQTFATVVLMFNNSRAGIYTDRTGI